jgi:Mg2+-importing ATPase
VSRPATDTREELALPAAAALDGDEVLVRLGSGDEGLTSAGAARRLEEWGPNAVRTHRAGALRTLGRQLRSALLLLLVAAATVSFFLGERADAVIIAAILGLSIGLGFLNEYRAEVAAEALHSRIRHRVVVRRDGRWSDLDVTELVPGDVVRLELGAVVPADLRLLEATDLELDESILTGESMPVSKSAVPAPSGGAEAAGLASCVLMGTVVRAGSGRGVAVATGPRTEFGRIALRLGERQPETEFQVGLRRFSLLLARVAAVLTGSIFVVNLLLHRPLIDALLFSLAIAVGITPQLLPAVVTTSLATGARRMIQRKVLVKRLVAIEDLGNVEVLFTDKTGTLTEGRITFGAALDPAGRPSENVLRLGLACNDAVLDRGVAVGGNPLDVALWGAPEAAPAKGAGIARLATLPFDHDRRMASVLVDDGEGSRTLVTKGAPETVLERCREAPESARAVLDAAFEAGSRVVAVATRPWTGPPSLGPQDEHDLRLAGFLLFLDPPKPSARESLARLARLGIGVKILTGDNPVVAEHVCAELGLASTGTLTGPDVDGMDDDALVEAVVRTTIFARVSPEQKARIIRIQRGTGRDVGFLGDGVNDAVALHDADVGISVESAVDVAKDAADVVLLEKDLGVLADGVVEGRRIFSNTMKYVLMGTSSNFGNMFSAAGASAFLRFLPMLPSQILLNNLLYDAGQLTIPTDEVDEEQLERPSRWDIRLIERFMLVFGPLSSLFDFVTFALMVGVFHAGPALFRSGWFVESLATQALVIFVIRTRRTPFWRSRPSRPLLAASLACVAVGAALPFSPFAHTLGFRRLPPAFFGALAGMVLAYLALVEAAKARFFRHPEPARPVAARADRRHRSVQRVASRYSSQ